MTFLSSLIRSAPKESKYCNDERREKNKTKQTRIHTATDRKYVQVYERMGNMAEYVSPTHSHSAVPIQQTFTFLHFGMHTYAHHTYTHTNTGTVRPKPKTMECVLRRIFFMCILNTRKERFERVRKKNHTTELCVRSVWAVRRQSECSS